jgi:AcrR family transcriptional regulator
MAKRRHVTGEATRTALMVAAERLFAERGVEGVTMREIQERAGQSNASVIAYHFGSKTGLVQALIRWRHTELDRRRSELLDHAREADREHDPRSVVWLVVRPLAESIAAGEMFVPFLARLSENPRATLDYWPADIDDGSTDLMEKLVGGAIADMPDRLRRGRAFQLYNSVLNLLGEQARAAHPISEVQLHNYVDAWVGMLTAPASEDTRALLAGG